MLSVLAHRNASFSEEADDASFWQLELRCQRLGLRCCAIGGEQANEQGICFTPLAAVRKP